MLKKQIISLFSFIAFSLIGVNAQSYVNLPPGAIQGELPNGLKYILMDNPTPTDRVEYKLVVRVGSTQELDNECGVAHFLEHQAFATSTNFPNGKAVKYLESKGMKYGRDINAMTGYDRTQYMFATPANDISMVDTSLLIMRDWLTEIQLVDSLVDGEKGIITEELRGFTFGDNFYDLKIGNNIYSKRMPLGDQSDIDNMTAERLHNFYHKWYDPSIAAIIIVGQIDTEYIESEIKRLFADIPSRNIKIKQEPLTYDKGVIMRTQVDTLVERISVDMMVPAKAVSLTDFSAHVRQEQERMAMRMVARRVSEVDARVSKSWFLSDKDHFAASFFAHTTNGVYDKISAVSQALQNIAHYGVTANEVEHYASELSQGILRRNYNRTSDMWSSIFLENFVVGETNIYTHKQDSLLVDYLMQTTSADIVSIIKEQIKAAEQTIIITATSPKDISSQLTKDGVLNAWKSGLNATPKRCKFVSPKHTKTNSKLQSIELLEATPNFDAENIASIKNYDNIGVVHYTLTNGINVIFRPTPEDTEQEISLSLISPSGYAWIPSQRYRSLEGAVGYIELATIKGVKPSRLSDYMYEKELSIIATNEKDWHGMLATIPADNSQILFNYIYQKIHNSDLPKKELRAIRKQLKDELNDGESSLVKMLERDSDRSVVMRTRELMGETSSVDLPALNKKDIDNLKVDTLVNFFKELYSTTQGTTYIVSGNYNLEEVARQFVSTFGSQPHKSLPEWLNAPQFLLPKNDIKESFKSDNQTQSTIDIILAQEYEAGLENSLSLKLMRDILQQRVIQILREKESITYSPYVQLSYFAEPNNISYFDFTFSVQNENLEYAKTLIDGILRDLSQKPVSVEELDQYKTSFLITKRNSLNDNSTSQWRDALTKLVRNGETLSQFDNYDNILKSITSEMLHKRFKKLYDNSLRVELIQKN